MASRRSRVRRRGLGLLAVVTVAVLALGWIVARDLRHTADDAGLLYDQLSRRLSFIDELQFHAGETRRILLYALDTSDANLQLRYVEESRAAGSRVEALLRDRGGIVTAPGQVEALGRLRGAWSQYLSVRDEVIGLMLEGSLSQAVALDAAEETSRYSEVRDAMASLRRGFEADAAIQVRDARVRADRATQRLLLLVVSALIATALGIYLVSRRAALEDLLRSEAHKGSILQAVPDPIVSTDAGGCIIELNDAAARTFGLTRTQALGAPIDTALLAPRSRGALAAMLAPDADPSGVISPSTFLTAARQDGTEFPIELSAISHEAAGERIWTVHLADRTAQLVHEEELRKAKETAEVAARAESDFLTTMSHELRTPLSAVIGIADLLQAERVGGHQRELIRMLRSNATTLLCLVSDILDFSRIDAGLMELTPAPFSLHGCTEDAIDAVAELAMRKGLSIGYVLPHDVPDDLVADEGRIRQVLVNLLSNAVKFTESGVVGVRARVLARTDDGVEVALTVSDTGPGIPAEVQSNLFRQFVQPGSSGRRHGGAGLGLAISRRLSGLLGGKLTLDSTGAGGSSFTFSFRAALDATRTETRPDSLAGMKVLALFEAGIVAEQIQAVLDRWGATSSVVSSDADGLMNREFDVLIVDAESSHLRALALRLRARARVKHVPVIVVTRMKGAMLHKWGANTTIVHKPVRNAALFDALCQSVAQGQVALRRRSAPRPKPRSLSILLVEDNDANRAVLRLMIEELGFDADEAVSGTDAVTRAQQREYDVIFMDLQMPDIDGREATRRIRAVRSGRRPRIIALTANVIRGEEERWRMAGIDEYLAKPVRLDTLEAALRSSIVPGEG